jgi:hypothetical protein
VKLSILMPSLFPDLAKQSIQSIYDADCPCEYEIVVVAPYSLAGPHIVSVPEPDSRGVNPAAVQAYQHSTGDIVLAWSDDVLMYPGALRIALDFFQEREREFELYCCGLHFGEPRGRSLIGTVFGIYYAWFPLVRRTTVDRVGGYLSTEYTSGWGDADLGMRIWQAGGRCEASEKSYVRQIPNRDALPESDHKNRNKLEDMRAFARKWSPVFGHGWNVNELRNFNIDLPGEALVDHTFLVGPAQASLARTRAHLVTSRS